LKEEYKISKDKLEGGIKEALGKITDDEGLELKGKLQSMKADLAEKTEDMTHNLKHVGNDIRNKAGEMKEEVLEKANSFLDKVR
jgi:uncharacterized protein YjbJ (UPF0337 family)